MYNQFIRAIRWNTVGVVFYKALLFIHQSILFSYISQSDYGIVGAIFSTIYFLIPVSNFGFDYTLLSFFKKTKSNIEARFILKQYTYRTITLACFIGFLSIIFAYNQVVSWSLFIACAILFFFENIKHSLRTHAHIFHLNKKIAIYENISLLIYISLIWSYYGIYKSIPTLLLFVPLAVSSTIETVIIGFIVKSAYSQLHSSKKPAKIDQKQFFKESLFNYINQVAKALFSPNFLIIFLSGTIGFYKTGYIKFITNIIIFFYTIFYRSIHMSGGALLSSISEMPKKLISKTFNTIASYYTQVLITLSIYISGLLYLHFQKTSFLQQSEHFSLYSIIILFCFISFLEYGTLTYETLFITQKQGGVLAKINSINIIGVFFCMGLAWIYPQPIFLLLLCGIKIGTTSYIMWRAYTTWKTAFSFNINITHVSIHAAITLTAISYFL